MLGLYLYNQESEVNITFVAHDMAPSQCFAALMTELKAHRINSFLGRGRPLMSTYDERFNAILQSTFVLIGMSSSPEFAMDEIEAAHIAIEHGIPFGFYADVPLCIQRARPGAWFAGATNRAKLVTGLLPHDLTTTSRVFPSADIIRTGNPMRDMMAFPKLTRAQVREKFGVKDDELFILAPGGKFMMGNAIVWTTILEAVEQLSMKAVIGFTPHPGDPAIRAVDEATGKQLTLYGDFIRYVRGVGIRTTYFESDFLPTMDAVAGADVVIEFTGSASVAAAYQRIPVVNVLPELWMRHFASECGDEALIETVKNGASIAVRQTSPDVLSSTLHRLFKLDAQKEQLREAQKKAYPLPLSPTASLEALTRAVLHYCA
jgi:hypothetical protein